MGNDKLKNIIRMEVPYFQAPNDIFDLDIKIVVSKRKNKEKGNKEMITVKRTMKAFEKLIYIYLCRCANNGSEAFPSYKKISQTCGISTTTAKECIDVLIKNNMIIKYSRYKKNTREQDSNVYEILVPHCMPSDQPSTPSDQRGYTLGDQPSMPGDKYKELPKKNYTKKELYIKIIDYLNKKSGTSYRSTTKKTQTCINARLEEGFSEEDFYTVIDKKTTEWRGTEWEIYLRPETLFGTKFESYLNQKGGFKSGSSRKYIQESKPEEEGIGFTV